MTNEKLAEFESVVRPVIKWLNENFHPHCKILITPIDAEILEGAVMVTTLDFTRD